MKFASLQFLWILWLIPLSVVFYILTGVRQRRKTEKIISKELLSEVVPEMRGSRRNIKRTIILIGLVFLCLALLGPQWGYQLREVKRRGVDLFVLVDVSVSMGVQDIKPSRMERAKRELVDLLSHLTGDRIGLIPFAGRAYVACPLTTDYNAFQLFIDHLGIDLIPVQGTDIGGALNLALNSFEPGESRSKAVILITDGEATLGDLPKVVSRIKEEKVRVFVIGMGSIKGAPIPQAEGNGFKQDQEGRVVISKLNEASLQKLAVATGGSYVRSVTGDLDLEQIYLKGIKQVVEEKELKSGKKKIPLERFQIPLFVALLLLGLEPFVREIGRSLLDKGGS